MADTGSGCVTPAAAGRCRAAGRLRRRRRRGAASRPRAAASPPGGRPPGSRSPCWRSRRARWWSPARRGRRRRVRRGEPDRRAAARPLVWRSAWPTPPRRSSPARPDRRGRRRPRLDSLDDFVRLLVRRRWRAPWSPADRGRRGVAVLGDGRVRCRRCADRVRLARRVDPGDRAGRDGLRGTRSRPARLASYTVQLMALVAVTAGRLRPDQTLPSRSRRCRSWSGRRCASTCASVGLELAGFASS